MPTYSMKNTKTDEVFEIRLSMAEREEYLANNQHIVQVFTKFPAIGDSVRLGFRKPDASFNDVLLNVKKSHYKSNINTR